MLYMISSRSVSDGASLSVTKSKLVYNSLIFVDRKLTLIYQQNSDQQQFLTVIHKLFCLSGEFCIFEDKRLRRMWCMTQSILPVTLPNVHRFKKNSFTRKLNDIFCNEITINSDALVWSTVVRRMRRPLLSRTVFCGHQLMRQPLNSGLKNFATAYRSSKHPSSSQLEKDGRSDRLDRRRSAKLTIPPSFDARSLQFIIVIVKLCLQHATVARVNQR